MLHLYLLLGLGVETVVLLVYESYWGAVLALGLVEDLVENLLVLDVRSPGECVVIQVAVFEVDDRDYFEATRVGCSMTNLVTTKVPKSRPCFTPISTAAR